MLTALVLPELLLHCQNKLWVSLTVRKAWRAAWPIAVETLGTMWQWSLHLEPFLLLRSVACTIVPFAPSASPLIGAHGSLDKAKCQDFFRLVVQSSFVPPHRKLVLFRMCIFQLAAFVLLLLFRM